MSKTGYIVMSILCSLVLVPFAVIILMLALGPLGVVIGVPGGIIGGFVMAKQIADESRKKREQAELAVAQKLAAGLPLNAKEQAILDEIKARAESKGVSGNE